MIGQTFGKYRIVERLGRGGMGTVYRAIDETLGRDVAIKVLNPDLVDSDLVRRFRSEATTLARLNHPGIATVYELYRDEKELFLVMEFVRGETVDKVAQRLGPLAPDQAAGIALQILEPLGYAHKAGVVHRDLKPANLMLTEFGGIKIMDFGIARVLGSEHMTIDGMMMGTPAYMAPEQVLGEEVDGRADLYAVGVILYRLLTGNLPFRADTAIAMVQKQIKDPPTPLRQFQSELPAWCESVLERALAKLPADRFQSAGEFKAALVACGATAAAGAPVVAAGATAPIASDVPLEATLPPDTAVPVPAALGRTLPPHTPARLRPEPVSASAAEVVAPAPAPVTPAAAAPASAARVQKAAPKTRYAIAAIVLLGLVAGIVASVIMRRTGVEPSAPTATLPAAQPTTTPAPPTAAAPSEATGRAEVPASAAPQQPPPAKVVERSTTTKPLPPGTSPSRTAPPAAADAASAPAPSPAPAATIVQPVTFTGVKALITIEGKSVERDVDLRFAQDVVSATPKDGPGQTVSYADVISAAYSRSRDPLWKTPAGARPVVKLSGGGFQIFRGDRNWLTIRTAKMFVILRLKSEQIRAVTTLLAERTGKAVERLEER